MIRFPRDLRRINECVDMRLQRLCILVISAASVTAATHIYSSCLSQAQSAFLALLGARKLPFLVETSYSAREYLFLFPVILLIWAITRGWSKRMKDTEVLLFFAIAFGYGLTITALVIASISIPLLNSVISL